MTAYVPLTFTLIPIYANDARGPTTEINATASGPLPQLQAVTAEEGYENVTLRWRNPHYAPEIKDIRMVWRNRTTDGNLGSTSFSSSHPDVFGRIDLNTNATNKITLRSLTAYVPLTFTLIPIYANDARGPASEINATASGPLPQLQAVTVEEGYENVMLRWRNPLYAPEIKDIRMVWRQQSTDGNLGSTSFSSSHPDVFGRIDLNTNATNKITLRSLTAYVPLTFTLIPIYANDARGPASEINATASGPLPQLQAVTVEEGYENVMLRWRNPHYAPEIKDIRIVWRQQSTDGNLGSTSLSSSHPDVFGRIDLNTNATNKITLRSLTAYVPLTFTLIPIYANDARGPTSEINATASGPLPQLQAVTVEEGYENVTLRWRNPHYAPEIKDIRIVWRQQSTDEIIGSTSFSSSHPDVFGRIDLNINATNKITLRSLTAYVPLTFTLIPIYANDARGPTTEISATASGPLPQLQAVTVEEGYENVTLRWRNPHYAPEIKDIRIVWRQQSTDGIIGSTSFSSSHPDVFGRIDLNINATNKITLRSLTAYVPLTFTLIPIYANDARGPTSEINATASGPLPQLQAVTAEEGYENVTLRWRNPRYAPEIKDIRIVWRQQSTNGNLGSTSLSSSHPDVSGRIDLNTNATNKITLRSLTAYVPLTFTLIPIYANDARGPASEINATASGPLPQLQAVTVEEDYENVMLRWRNPLYAPEIKDIRIVWRNRTTDGIIGSTSLSSSHPDVFGRIDLNINATNKITLRSLTAYVPLTFTLIPIYANDARGPTSEINATASGPLPQLQAVTAEEGYENVMLRWKNPHYAPEIKDIRIVWRNRTTDGIIGSTSLSSSHPDVSERIDLNTNATNKITLRSLTAYVPLTFTLIPIYANDARGPASEINATASGPLPQLQAVTVEEGYENVTLRWRNPHYAPEIKDIRIAWRNRTADRIINKTSFSQQDAFDPMQLSANTTNAITLTPLAAYVPLTITLRPIFTNDTIGPMTEINATPRGPLPQLQSVSTTAGHENVTVGWRNPLYAPEITDIVIRWWEQPSGQLGGITSHSQRHLAALGKINLNAGATNTITLTSLNAHIPLTITITLILADDDRILSMNAFETPQGPLPQPRAYTAIAGHTNVTLSWTNPMPYPPLADVMINWKRQGAQEYSGSNRITALHSDVVGEIDTNDQVTNVVTIKSLAPYIPIDITLTLIFAHDAHGPPIHLSATPFFICTLIDDCDGDGVPDTVDLGFNENSKVACTFLRDCDKDGVEDAVDVDDDGDGLMELWTAEMFNNMRFDTNGEGYRINNISAATQNGCGGDSRNLACRGYELINNVSLADYSQAGWLPIGTEDEPFSAVFKGNSHTIADVVIKKSAYSSTLRDVGIFGYVSDTQLNDIILANITIEKSRKQQAARLRKNIGSLAGRMHNTRISGVRVMDVDIKHANASIGGLVGFLTQSNIAYSSATQVVIEALFAANIGGLVGRVWGDVNITFSYVQADIRNRGTSSVDGVGGLVGICTAIPSGDEEGEVNIISSGTDKTFIYGYSNLGGLIGAMDNDIKINIFFSFANHTMVVGEGHSVGGLIGKAATATIIASFARFDVLSGHHSVGGIIGETTLFGQGDIISSYSRGGVIFASHTVGGLIGYGNLFTAHSFAAAPIFYLGDQDYYSQGGLSGSGAAPYSPFSSILSIDSYFDNTLANFPTLSEQIGRNSSELQSGNLSSWQDASMVDVLSQANNKKLDPLMHIWCDRNINYVIDPQERHRRYWIWRLGTDSVYPTLRCTPVRSLTQQDHPPAGVGNFITASMNNTVNLGWQNPTHSLEDLILVLVVWEPFHRIAYKPTYHITRNRILRLSQIEPTVDLSADAQNNITIGYSAINDERNNLFILVPLYPDGTRGEPKVSSYHPSLCGRPASSC